MIRTRKLKKVRPIAFDREKRVLLIRKNAVIDKKINFDGKIIVGMDACIWAAIECDEILIGKASYLKGDVRCRKATVGAKTEFNSIVGDEILIQNGCRGRVVKGKKVILRKGVEIENLEADIAYIDGISKLGRVNVKKVVAAKSV
ncbi:MAG: hypothetical protein H0Z28_01140 [Archaeoglobus sp.]|nr:hypothetical protein [Archaeoglobus sp.]